MKFHTHTHTHTRLTALCPGLPGWAGTRKVKPIWILLEQETVSGSGISWAICKSAPRSRQITTPAPHYSSFLQAGCPSCHPTNSVKALKARHEIPHVVYILIITVKHEYFACISFSRFAQNRKIKYTWISRTAHYQNYLQHFRDVICNILGEM